MSSQFITDPHNDSVKVLTVTNQGDRITRLVVKMNTYCSIEVMYLMASKYEWYAETLSINREELLAMADAVRTQIPEEE